MSTIPVAFLAVAKGYHPAAVVPLLIGVFLPELDTVRSGFHRSWLVHTFLVPAVIYVLGSRSGLFGSVPILETTLQFITLGLTLHFFADYVYPQRMSHEGAVWPVRPEGFSAPWGLIWLGMVWTFQWFGYLVPSFIPWLFKALVFGTAP
ncbi:hypothetical protein ACFQE1_01940 [Halobium palmae]|uniref:Metal-dependent hydrolase n=1 Tax=Halobium palmae TaxID=1776492 RepID=A0ABD5RV00_9EURY